MFELFLARTNFNFGLEIMFFVQDDLITPSVFFLSRNLLFVLLFKDTENMS